IIQENKDRNLPWLRPSRLTSNGPEDHPGEQGSKHGHIPTPARLGELGPEDHPGEKESKHPQGASVSGTAGGAAERIIQENKERNIARGTASAGRKTWRPRGSSRRTRIETSNKALQDGAIVGGPEDHPGEQGSKLSLRHLRIPRSHGPRGSSRRT